MTTKKRLASSYGPYYPPTPRGRCRRRCRRPRARSSGPGPRSARYPEADSRRTGAGGRRVQREQLLHRSTATLPCSSSARIVRTRSWTCGARSPAVVMLCSPVASCSTRRTDRRVSPASVSSERCPKRVNGRKERLPTATIRDRPGPPIIRSRQTRARRDHVLSRPGVRCGSQTDAPAAADVGYTEPRGTTQRCSKSSTSAAISKSPS